MFELPVAVKLPPETRIGPVDFPPSGNVMIMFVPLGSPQAETVQIPSRATWPGKIEQPEPVVVPPPDGPPWPFPASAAGASASTIMTTPTTADLEMIVFM